MAKITSSREPVVQPPLTFHLELDEQEFLAIAWIAYRKFSGGQQITTALMEAAKDNGLYERVASSTKPAGIFSV